MESSKSKPRQPATLNPEAFKLPALKRPTIFISPMKPYEPYETL